MGLRKELEQVVNYSAVRKLQVFFRPESLMCDFQSTKPHVSSMSFHNGIFFNGLNLVLGVVCAVSAGKFKVAGPAEDDSASAAVSHRKLSV